MIVARFLANSLTLSRLEIFIHSLANEDDYFCLLNEMSIALRMAQLILLALALAIFLIRLDAPASNHVSPYTNARSLRKTRDWDGDLGLGKGPKVLTLALIK